MNMPQAGPPGGAPAQPIPVPHVHGLAVVRDGGLAHVHVVLALLHPADVEAVHRRALRGVGHPVQGPRLALQQRPQRPHPPGLGRAVPRALEPGERARAELGARREQRGHGPLVLRGDGVGQGVGEFLLRRGMRRRVGGAGGC